jgi:glycosyltransferase involved in cell wall biosynthesis
MKTVDVVMLTKNSERLLRQCLTSVYENVPVSNLIVVDGYSADTTLDIVKEFQERYGNVILLQDHGTRGCARQKAIGKVKTDWFMFVDSDVLLCEGWFDRVKKFMRDGVGAVWGIEIWSVLRKSRFLKQFERITMKIFESRGGTHDLLVRTKAVEGMAIPPSLHTYEDLYIKSYIRGKGYEVIPVYDPYCLHFRPENVWTIGQSIFFVASDLKFAVRRPQLLLSYAFYTLIVLYESFSRNLVRRNLPR